MLMDAEKKNVIPRKFYQITGEMLINTSMDRAGDKVHIFKNDTGYLALNLRTQKYARIFPQMLRDPRIFKLEEVIAEEKQEQAPEIQEEAEMEP